MHIVSSKAAINHTPIRQQGAVGRVGASLEVILIISISNPMKRARWNIENIGAAAHATTPIGQAHPTDVSALLYKPLAVTPVSACSEVKPSNTS